MAQSRREPSEHPKVTSIALLQVNFVLYLSMSERPRNHEVSLVQEEDLTKLLSIRELLRKTEASIPRLVQASTLGAIALSGLQIIAVNRKSQPCIVDEGGDFTPITPSCELYNSSGPFTADLLDGNMVTPNPYALDLVLSFDSLDLRSVFRVGSKDRHHLDSHGIEFSLFSRDFKIDVAVVTGCMWRVEMTRTQGQHVRSLSFTSPLQPGPGDSFFTFKYELLRLDKPGAALVRLRQDVGRLKESQLAGSTNGSFDEHDLVIKDILRFYDTLGETYTPGDFKRDRLLLITTQTADEFLREFLEGIEKDPLHKLPRGRADLLATAMEKRSEKPDKNASISVSFRHIKKDPRFTLSAVVAAGMDEGTKEKFVAKTRAVINRNPNELALLRHIWSQLIEDNMKNFEALIQADINFPNEDFEEGSNTGPQEPER